MKTINSKREAALPYNGLQVLFVREVKEGSPSFEGQPPQVIVTFPNSTSLVNGQALPNGTEVQFYADEIVDSDPKSVKPGQPALDTADYEKSVTARAKQLCENAHGVGSWESSADDVKARYIAQARAENPRPPASQPPSPNKNPNLVG